jgi:hypothetical protein
MKKIKSFLIICILFAGFFSEINPQQISINRIELMPNIPSPYVMRDWKNVTMGYDSLVFDFNRSGNYLPLIWLNTNTINYPEHNSLGLNTVVGTTSPSSSEGINVLPAVISASLAGIDKSNQNGFNWVLMCEEYFNKANAANVYLNHPNGSNWDDWWYDVMPNVFFYQLYDLYPGTGDFSNQFKLVADRWLEAVKSMGGSSTPWKIPLMNYRAFNLLTMQPFSSGVIEPEAAGALAWIFYNAYTETGEEKYRIGAEWSLEFLNSLSTNPAYELQLPYGVYAAARMNAELWTNYDIEKMLNWCFNVGSLRSWGSILGKWGGYDVSGLIGEVNGSNDYAFLMNTFEQASALVPMVRYDDRFARAIGKWILNSANAARLFYTNYLPDQNQDSEEWSHQYDPNSYIGHEALRQTLYANSPYATGDAIDGGWGSTNLSLYSSSHVGIYGGIIDTTNIPMILRLDLLKTDYFHKDAYPSYLFYNPYQEEKTVDIDVGIEVHDIYDAVSNSIIITGVSGKTTINIPADAAVIAVIIPGGSTIIYQDNLALVNNRIIDFKNGQTVANYNPRIKALSSDKTLLLTGDTCSVYCTAVDLDNNNLSYHWSDPEGNISDTTSSVKWIAPAVAGNYIIKCTVSDNVGGIASDSVQIEVTAFINSIPIIQNIIAIPRKIQLGSTSLITCVATDSNGDDLTYNWSSYFGSFSGTGASVNWTAPINAGDYFLRCRVNDGRGGEAVDSICVAVRDTNIKQTGELVAFYPFNGNANDVSGYNNNGVISGPVLVADRWGNSSSAYYFDGVNDNIEVANSTSLNFQNSMSINLWINIGDFFDREAYPISHGNWENRWKISITNKHLRWTIKTVNGIKDLDSETELTKNTLYNITATYDGSYLEIYINGYLDAFVPFTGPILTTTIDLMIGQVLPGNTQYNFKGTLDDIRIYNYALSLSEIKSLNDFPTNTENEQNINLPEYFELTQNYPNPFNGQTNIEYKIPVYSRIRMEVFDLLGQKVKTLIDEEKSPGIYKAKWDGKNDLNNSVDSGIYFVKLSSDNFSNTKKMILLK